MNESNVDSSAANVGSNSKRGMILNINIFGQKVESELIKVSLIYRNPDLCAPSHKKRKTIALFIL
jgi:hypothetical protein